MIEEAQNVARLLKDRAVLDAALMESTPLRFMRRSRHLARKANG